MNDMDGKGSREKGNATIEALQQEITGLKARLEQHEQHERRIHEIIEKVSRSIHQLDSFEITAAFIFRACKQSIGARSGYVALLTPDGQENSVLYLDAGGMPCTVDPNLPMPIRGLRAEAYKSKLPAIDNNFTDSRWMQYMPAGHVALQNVMFAPMVIGDQAKGLFGLANKPSEFTREDADIAMIYAEIAAIALQSSHMIEEIKKTNDQLQDANQDAGFLKDLLVHDIRNVFQAISSVVGLWNLRLSRESQPAGLVDSLGVISAHISRGASLITSIQQLEKLGDPRLALEQLDVIAPLRETISLLRKRHPSKQLDITLQVDDEPIIAIATSLLRDVYENILNNAVMHSPRQAIKIQVIVRRVGNGDGSSVRLEFIDNGTGIEDDRKATIFDRSSFKKPGKEGLGIGLSVVKRILARCGGKIWVEDAVKGDHARGSKFIVVLPAPSKRARAAGH
ncbi:MAG: GAF domain-containing sensor histidine kinase [Candidatus Lokiarchaeota archaeon]|nr:GAF domain-containing sensor histidine kinase [Candidatus Lokiarchaeota archaeon]